MVTAHGTTHPGGVRKNNEDAFLSEPRRGLFVVADGMGGHNAGEVASTLAVDAISGFLARSEEGEDFTWPYGIEAALSFEGNRLMTAVKLANRRVFKASENRDDYAGLGTTVVAALIAEGHVTYTGVGDSRIYSFARGALTQLTQDDSWAATVLGNEGSASDRASHPMRHVLTNVLGAREQLDMDVDERPLVGGETLLLCSDGLHGALDDGTIAEVLGAGGPVATIADTLVQLALARDGGDNITALVVRWDEGTR